MTRARRATALAVLSGLLLGAVALPAVGRSADPVRRERLPNGLTVIIRDNPLTPVVAMALLLRMGTRWEAPEQNGITNFLHAVMVKGTTRRSGADIAQAIAVIGGKLTAAGDMDYSGIQAQALSRFWRDLLALTAEVALEPRLAPEEVGIERDWLLSRIQRQRDNPSARAFDELYGVVYGAHPYARPVLGTPETLARIDHAAIVAHYRATYRPERMVLVVSGQIPTDEVLAEVRRLFGALPGGAPAPDPTSPPPTATGRRVVIEQAAQQAQVLSGGLAPSVNHPDHAPVKVLSAVLGGGMAGRLFAELRDRQALAYSASTFYDPVKEPGILVLYLGTAPDNVQRAEEALRKEIDRIRREPVSADDLRRAKGYLLGTYAMDRRTNARQAWYLGFYEVERVGLDFPEHYRRAVEAVTAADVTRVAQTYLANPSTVIVQPPRNR